jgi:hypothetical protein
MATIAFFTLLISFHPFITNAEPRSDIVEFLEITGIFEGLQGGANLYLQDLMQKYPNATNEFWHDVSEHELKRYTTSMKSFYIALYSDYFTKAEMLSILEFFKTPHGSKLQKLNTVLLPKFMEAGKKEQEKLNRDIDSKLSKMGYK